MILIDSSAWIHFLRPDGDAEVRQRVLVALRAGLAAWCPIVRLELWNGAGGDRERVALREFARVLPELPITADVWDHACVLGSVPPPTEEDAMTSPFLTRRRTSCPGS